MTGKKAAVFSALSANLSVLCVLRFSSRPLDEFPSNPYHGRITSVLR
jgi:hypothetical protein